VAPSIASPISSNSRSRTTSASILSWCPRSSRRENALLSASSDEPAATASRSTRPSGNGSMSCHGRIPALDTNLHTCKETRNRGEGCELVGAASMWERATCVCVCARARLCEACVCVCVCVRARVRARQTSATMPLTRSREVQPLHRPLACAVVSACPIHRFVHTCDTVAQP
jgi:hypothetical protein